MQIEINKPILELNDRLAAANRALLAQNKVFMLDIMASPGAGKTATILATIECLRERYRIAVIEGDVASDVDAQKIKASGITAVQINTGGACHLEAAMIERALEMLPLAELDLIIVENVGNLVCPTEFDLGQTAQAVILSVPEGDDKPQKYPGIFAIADVVLLNKLDALPLFDFSVEQFTSSLEALNPTAALFQVSTRTKAGIADWATWLSNIIDA
ncbi:MAG: hydrogenase nickel incorporation protein HypB [Coriobacteriales bacterium]|jgi:hydrogenase nickel incorporation protein HypB|nr:hydrogenase nickel incorporation protein HypB [Coriobacteriales bacterium]